MIDVTLALLLIIAKTGIKTDSEVIDTAFCFVDKERGYAEFFQVTVVSS